MSTGFLCPCCGFDGLELPPDFDIGRPPYPNPGPPPCARYFSHPSREVCPCCGFQFGVDDEPGRTPPVPFELHREVWILNGCPWYDPRRRPMGWSLCEQLRRAGISMRSAA